MGRVIRRDDDLACDDKCIDMGAMIRERVGDSTNRASGRADK